MPFIVPFLPLIAGAAGVAGSAMASGSKTTKTTVTPVLSPELQSAQDADLKTLQGIIGSPDSGLGPIKAASQDQINKNYSLLPQIATTKLAARGFGSSGAVGNGIYDLEGARLGDLSSLEGQMAQLTSNRQLSVAQIINQMIQTGKGTQVTETTPSQSLAAALLSGAGQLSSFLSNPDGYTGKPTSSSTGSSASSPLGSLSALAVLSQMMSNGGNVPNVISGTGSVNANTPVPIGSVIGSQGLATALSNPSNEGWGPQ